MLVITRRFGESFTIGDDITVTIGKGMGRQVKIMIDAPRHLNIVRTELTDKHKEEDHATTQVSG